MDRLIDIVVTYDQLTTVVPFYKDLYTVPGEGDRIKRIMVTGVICIVSSFTHPLYGYSTKSISEIY